MATPVWALCRVRSLFESSPPAPIPIVSPTSDEHEKHNDDHSCCHDFLQTFTANSAWNSSPLVRLVSCR